MFIAHLPAGYVLTRTIQNKAKKSQYMALGLLGSVFPDLDLVYFYLVDQRQTMHHYYWIHIPFYWFLISMGTFLMIYLFKRTQYKLPAFIFFTAIFLHLLLDTVVGNMLWLYPFSESLFAFFEVPAIYDFWVYNFIFHWTFLFEILLILWAACLFFKARTVKIPKN